MPFPLLIVGVVAGGASLAMSGHSAWKQRKWKKIYDERLSEFQVIQKEAEGIHSRLQAVGESLGRVKVQASRTVEEAAEYLQAVAKKSQTKSLPKIPSEVLKEWINLRSEIVTSLGIGVAGAAVSGVTASAGPALYTAAGLFGVASTGTRIASLSGAAANSARLAWIGGGAVAAGGGGMVLGATVLNVLSKANIVMAPIALGAGIWSEKKAHELEKKVTDKVQEFADAEAKLRRKMTAMQLSITRAGEIQDSVQETDTALKNLLQNAETLKLGAMELAVNSDELRRPDLHVAHQIYLTAKTLRELIEQSAISEANRRIIEE